MQSSVYDRFTDPDELFDLMTESKDAADRRAQVQETAQQLRTAWTVVCNLTGSSTDEIHSVQILF